MNKVRSYKGVPVNSFGFPIYNPSKKPVKSKHNKRIFLNTFLSNVKKGTPKNLIVMYDIPHEKKKERDWFRRHLKKFNYIMIQKSVWVGPSPLPKDFIDYVKSIDLQDKLKTFKLAKPYTEKENNF
ncbi:MAG: CRISPR-associated endonuclease Cas2 [Candidatus Taylorbacteria bacterium]|nr:CRISPR-associated endonuclease Cas2 [Candidatus Taylorbacteria bacterium]